MKYSWINGKFLLKEQAVLQVEDLALQRGYGIFDFFRCPQGRPFLWESHCRRFFYSAKGLRLDPGITKKGLKEVVLELLHRNHTDDCGIKLTLTGGYSQDGYTPCSPNFVITQHHITLPPHKLYNLGCKVITHQYQRELPELKTINYLRGIYLLPQIKAKGAHDVLYYHDGRITEFPRSNFFMVDQHGEILTPGTNILSGITRESVLSIGACRVRETDVSLNQLLHAAEAFLTSTTKRIMPIVQIDGRAVGTGKPGPITKELMQGLQLLEEQQLRIT